MGSIAKNVMYTKKRNHTGNFTGGNKKQKS